MCITVAEARLSDTKIYAAEARKPTGEIVHVLGYQNKVSDARGPNAMLLPFPAAGSVGRENLVNGAQFAGVLGYYDEAIERLRPMTKSVSRNFSAAAADEDIDLLDVFQSGSYTIALVQKATALRQALMLMPGKVRPDISNALILALAKLYPNWPMALCCFEGGMSDPEPLFWWYEPRFPDRIFAPGLDAHSGGPPNVRGPVHRSHTLAFSALDSSASPDAQLWGQLQNVPAQHRWMFNPRVCGRKLNEETPNGDFVYPLAEIRMPTNWGWIPLRVVAPSEAVAT